MAPRTMKMAKRDKGAASEADFAAAAREIAAVIARALDDVSAQAVTLQREQALLAAGLLEGIAEALAARPAASET